MLASCSGSDARSEVAEPPAAGAIEVTDDAGRRVRLARPAVRVVSLLPAVTETLVAMGAADRLVARTDYDAAPAVLHLPSVGGGLTPSVEMLAALRPDLVIAWEEAGTARVRPRLEAIGIPVLAARTRDTADIHWNIARLGELLELRGSADSLSAALRRELEVIRSSVAGRERPSVLYMVSMDPPMVAGPGLFIGQMIEVAGGRNAFEEVGAHSPQISLEEIVRRRPDIVLIPSDSDSASVVQRLRGSAGWRELLASGHTRVRTLPPDLLHRPGPTLVEAARLLVEAIHPATVSGR